MKYSWLFVTCMVFALVGCVSYEHALDSESYNSRKKDLGEKFRFVQTETYDLVKSRDLEYRISMTTDSSQIKQLTSINRISKPTYKDVKLFVAKKYGEKATFANVVWDVKRVSFLTLESVRTIAVTFDVYMPVE
jgi:hypothetical protein